MKLGIVVSTPPERGDASRAAALAAAARRRRWEVAIFLMGPAVRLAGADAARGWLDDGCDVFACATDVERHGVGPVTSGVVVGSQDDHAAIAHRAERLVAFT